MVLESRCKDNLVNKEVFFMKNKLFLLGIGLLTISGLILGKKTGLFEKDDHLYDEYDTSK